MIPLLRLTGSRAVMGERADARWVRVLGGGVAALIVALNLALVVLTLAPQ